MTRHQSCGSVRSKACGLGYPISSMQTRPRHWKSCVFGVPNSPSANPRHPPYVLGVWLSASHELIGHVGFSPCEYGVEVGYAIGDAYQNRGYAKQAVFAATTWALCRFDLPFIYAIVA